MDVLRIDKENVPNFNLMKKKIKFWHTHFVNIQVTYYCFLKSQLLIVLTFSFIDHFIYTHDFHLFHCIVLR